MRYIIKASGSERTPATYLKNHEENDWTWNKLRAARWTTFEQAEEIAKGYTNDDPNVFPEPAPTVQYINAYSVSRHYGGPEEGGWWYDAGEPIASVPMAIEASEEAIEAMKRHLTKTIGWESKPNRFSVIGGDDFVIRIEEGPAQPFPATRPHYE